MSRASTLARAFGADGVFNVADVAGLGALASLNSVGSAQMSAGAAVANIGYTPVNKTGDTMTGPLTVGDVAMGRVQVDIMALWRSADMQGYKSSYDDGGGVNYTWDNGIVRVDASVGSHNWDVGRISLPAGVYRLVMQYRPSPTQHGWNVYGNNSNAHIFRLQTDAGYSVYNQLVSVSAQLNKDVGHSQIFISDPHTVTSAGVFRIGMQTDPYGGGGYKCFVEAGYLIKVA